MIFESIQQETRYYENICNTMLQPNQLHYDPN